MSGHLNLNPCQEHIDVLKERYAALVLQLAVVDGKIDRTASNFDRGASTTNWTKEEHRASILSEMELVRGDLEALLSCLSGDEIASLDTKLTPRSSFVIQRQQQAEGRVEASSPSPSPVRPPPRRSVSFKDAEIVVVEPSSCSSSSSNLSDDDCSNSLFKNCENVDDEGPTPPLASPQAYFNNDTVNVSPSSTTRWIPAHDPHVHTHSHFVRHEHHHPVYTTGHAVAPIPRPALLPRSRQPTKPREHEEEEEEKQFNKDSANYRKERRKNMLFGFSRSGGGGCSSRGGGGGLKHHHGRADGEEEVFCAECVVL
eukprot:PhM_4_TR7995/c0_g1_i1/m.94575